MVIQQVVIHITMMSYDRHGVSNYRQLECFTNCLD